MSPPADEPPTDELLPAANQPAVPVETSVSTALVERMLTNQVQQIQLQQQGLDLQSAQQKLDHELRITESRANAEYVMVALERQVADMQRERDHELAMAKTKYRNWLTAGIVGSVLTAGLIATCLAYGYVELLQDVAKMTLPPIATAIAGYFAGKQRGKKESDEETAAKQAVEDDE